ncbi:uncharacterized protein [Danio rerio]|uniref:Uncharacterized protein n=1 Tax=Danio rerio TaxID=7955 RepID=A0AC58GA28_DANRE
MNEQTTENPAILKKWLQKTRSRDDKEKEEINMQVEAEEQEIEEKNEEAARKEKQARVHSVFSLVRSQIRTQAGLDGQRVGIMDVVKQITKELEKNKKEQDESTPAVEISAPEQNTEARTAEKDNNEEQMTESEDSKKEKGEDLCVVLLEEILLNLESLRLELREELAQLRHETQSYTDQALCGLETRLTNSLRIQALARTTTLPRNHVAEPMETKKQRPPSMPPLGTSRRRVLNRTMTTITPKSCLPLSLGPRSNSEPLGAWRNETSANNSPPRREEVASHPPLGPLPPAIPHAQKGKKNLRSRNRIGKPTS